MQSDQVKLLSSMVHWGAKKIKNTKILFLKTLTFWSLFSDEVLESL